MKNFFENLHNTESSHPSENNGSVGKQREAMWMKLVGLGLSSELLASACKVTPVTAKKCIEEERLPNRWTAWKAVDRLGGVVQYMDEYLGLPDSAISSFLAKEPLVPEEERTFSLDPNLYREYWEEHVQESLLAEHILGYTSEYMQAEEGFPYGLRAFEERITLRFAERQVEEQAGIEATPESVR